MSPQRNPIGEAIPLPGLREQLTSEYGGVVLREKIDQVAEQALDELEDARIREFVAVLPGAAPVRACDRLHNSFDFLPGAHGSLPVGPPKDSD